LSRKRDNVEILLYLITGAFFGFLLSIFVKLPYEANVLVAIATFTLVIVTLWYAFSTHKLVKQPINLMTIKGIYAPLNDEATKIQKQIDDYGWSLIDNQGWPISLNPITSIKEKAFYVLADKSIRKSVEEWQVQAKKYFETREILAKEIQRVVDEEIDNRMKLINVDNTTNFRYEVSNTFHEFYLPYSFSRLIQGQVEDEEYYFISNLNKSNDPNKVKFATGFPKAIYKKIDKGQISTLHNIMRDTQTSFSSLKQALDKEISKIK